jgi:flagellar biosynthetic protein FliP
MFLTLLSMEPTFDRIEQHALTPLLDNKIQAMEAIKQASSPLKEHMISQIREQDMAFVLEISNKPMPDNISDLGIAQIVPAYMLSELRTAFMIGFMVFLPFLLVDIVVSGILMSMGMMMVPPMTISLPIKILMFVLIDGWTLVIRSILTTGM